MFRSRNHILQCYVDGVRWLFLCVRSSWQPSVQSFPASRATERLDGNVNVQLCPCRFGFVMKLKHCSLSIRHHQTNLLVVASSSSGSTVGCFDSSTSSRVMSSVYRTGVLLFHVLPRKKGNLWVIPIAPPSLLKPSPKKKCKNDKQYPLPLPSNTAPP